LTQVFAVSGSQTVRIRSLLRTGPILDRFVERLQSAGRRWTVALQSTGLSGIVTAVEAGLAISILAQSGLSPRLRALGPAQGLPALPDFEYVVRRNAKPSLAADRLRDVIIDYFQLAAALRRTSGNPNVQTSGRARVKPALGHKRT
jgi:DNA-binding transcriptional LysR family regulator